MTPRKSAMNAIRPYIDAQGPRQRIAHMLMQIEYDMRVCPAQLAEMHRLAPHLFAAINNTKRIPAPVLLAHAPYDARSFFEFLATLQPPTDH